VVAHESDDGYRLGIDEDEMCCQPEQDCLNYLIVNYITRFGIEVEHLERTLQ